MMKHSMTAAGWLTIFCLWLIPPGFALAGEHARRSTIWDIHLGDEAAAIPDAYVNYACGTNGGPPSLRLTSFVDFKKCKPDANGLHEVYFEYDDELEYEARALDDKSLIRMYAGTTVFEFPIVASILFDDAGLVRGERMVTDPRQQVSRDRLEFWELANFLHHRFGDDGWVCSDLPPEDGEKAAMTKFLKNRCEKITAEARLILDQRFFQKKGQQFTDPVTGKAQPQAFESGTRFEMYDAALGARNPDTK